MPRGTLSKRLTRLHLEHQTSRKQWKSSICIKQTMSLELGYWGIHGLGAPLRMMLTYAGVCPATRKTRTLCSAKNEREHIPSLRPH
jgi:hypothetical protein